LTPCRTDPGHCLAVRGHGSDLHDLLFAHRPVESKVLRPIVPAQLPLDTFDAGAGSEWFLFHMSRIHARRLPPLPGLSRFPELNVRTYVTLDGKPGVYFFSLDAANLPAVWTGRRFFRLLISRRACQWRCIVIASVTIRAVVE